MGNGSGTPSSYTPGSLDILYCTPVFTTTINALTTTTISPLSVPITVGGISTAINGSPTLSGLTVTGGSNLAATTLTASLTLTGTNTFMNESATNAITANATANQAAATALTSEVNRITTAANASAPYSSVALPTSAAGLTIFVINKGANPIQVFPANGSGDNIDGGAANASVTQMANSMVFFTCSVVGTWDSEGLGTGYSGAYQTINFADGLTAHAGGGGSSVALAITNQVVRVSTVATAADSVVLPASSAGLTFTITNSASNPLQVFSQGSDTINGIANTVGVSQMSNSTVTYVTTGANKYIGFGLGSGSYGQFPTLSATDGLTATAGGGGSSVGVLITTAINSVTTVANSSDSVVLPVSAPGLEVLIANRSSNQLAVFPRAADIINAQSAGATLTGGVGSSTSTLFYSTRSGQWHTK